MSHRHARIVVAADTATIEDLGSKNRTRANGQPVVDPIRLLDGDTIHIGAVSFLFRSVDVGATTETGVMYEPG